MTNNNAVCSRVLQGVFLAVLLAVFGLAACGSGGGSTTTTNTSPTTLPAPGGIVLSLVPARTSGVAPLAVFFDATATTDTGVTTRPFHDLEYTWDFGDPSSGTWASGAQPGVSSKNSATGPVAAHVFETPGTYIVTLTAFDGTNTAATTTTITVQDPNTVFAGTNTMCVSSNTTPVAGAGGCPTGAQVFMQPNFATAVNTYALTNRRVLFKRGDTFSAPTSAAITSTGPGILGAFGSGVKPVVQATWNGEMVTLSGRDTPTIRDWRIMDLEFDAMSNPASVGILALGGINQILIHNMNIHDIYRGVIFSDGILDVWYSGGYTSHSIWDQIAIVDSSITPIFNSITGWRIFASATRFFVAGNVLGNIINTSSMSSHTIRIPYAEKAVISNNTIARAGTGQLEIKMHSKAWCSNTSASGTCLTPDNNAPIPPGYSYLTNTHPIGAYTATSGYTEQVVVSNNHFISAQNPYSVGITAQDEHNDERLRDIIIERNWWTAGSGLQIGLLIKAENATVRNNIFDMTGAAYHTFINVSPRFYGPSADGINIYNNTLYNGSTGDFIGVNIDTTATHVSVINNLGSAPSATGPIMINGTGASGLIQSNNSTDAQIKNTFPGWVSAAPSTPADFSLTAGSYAREAGLAIPVWSDFFRTSRPLNGVMDMGAVEGP